VAQFEKRTGIQCDIVSDPEDIVLVEDHSIAIFRILQETLTNIARHANASRVNVILREKPGSVEMAVHDNGTGIRETQVLYPKSFGCGSPIMPIKSTNNRKL
jgi:signal transduction histidine kinase